MFDENELFEDRALEPWKIVFDNEKEKTVEVTTNELNSEEVKKDNNLNKEVFEEKMKVMDKKQRIEKFNGKHFEILNVLFVNGDSVQYEDGYYKLDKSGVIIIYNADDDLYLYINNYTYLSEGRYPDSMRKVLMS